MPRPPNQKDPTLPEGSPLLPLSQSHSEVDDEMSGIASSSETISYLQEQHVNSADQEPSGPGASISCALQQYIHLPICSGDFGKVVELKTTRSLSDTEKLALLKHCFVPSPCYTFPTFEISGHQRSFQHSWLGKYNGLCYSVTDNGGYCKFCVLFAKCGPSVSRLGVFIKRPFTHLRRMELQ